MVCFVLLSQGSFRVLVVCLLGFVLSVCVSGYCCCGYDATSVLERRRCCVLGGMNRDSFQERGEGMPVPFAGHVLLSSVAHASRSAQVEFGRHDAHAEG